MNYMTQFPSPLGTITIASDGTALTGLWLQGQKYGYAGMPVQCPWEELPVFAETKRWLEMYFQGEEPDFTPKLALSGTPFRMAVWEILLTIPYGKTMTYWQIAARIAEQKGMSRMSAQAVGGAVGHNPISIIVPCHRVVGTSGSLTGYAGGIDKKIALLTLEKVDMDSFFAPR